MFRWVVVLCAFLFAVMYFIGRDHGQVRQGLIGVTPAPAAEPASVAEAPAAEAVAPPAVAAQAEPAAAPAPATATENVPAAEVTAPETAAAPAPDAAGTDANSAKPPSLAELAAEAAADAAAKAEAAPAAQVAPETLLQPGETLGQALLVTARGAVVREGPGIQYKLVGRLTRGKPVQKVNQTTPLVGWTVIQFVDEQGQLHQGYVPSSLLGQP